MHARRTSEIGLSEEHEALIATHQPWRGLLALRHPLRVHSIRTRIMLSGKQRPGQNADRCHASACPHDKQGPTFCCTTTRTHARQAWGPRLAWPAVLQQSDSNRSQASTTAPGPHLEGGSCCSDVADHQERIGDARLQEGAVGQAPVRPGQPVEGGLELSGPACSLQGVRFVAAHQYRTQLTCQGAVPSSSGCPRKCSTHDPAVLRQLRTVQTCWLHAA